MCIRDSHGGAVKPDAVPQDARVEGHDVDDVPDAARALEGFVEFGFEQAGGFFEGDLVDPGHGVPLEILYFVSSANAKRTASSSDH